MPRNLTDSTMPVYVGCNRTPAKTAANKVKDTTKVSSTVTYNNYTDDSWAAFATAKATAEAAKKEAAEAKKAEKAKAKRDKKEAKKAEKKAKIQAKIDACPRDYKPLSTSKSFWTMLVCGIPALGILVSIIMSLVPVNKNIKFIAKALLVLHAIAIILILIALLVAVYVLGAELDSIIEAFQKFFEAMASAINL